MASSSGLVIPLTLFFIGTRLWALGKRFGHMTQVQFFRDRWECSGIGTFIFALTAAMLVPYIIIGVMGGGQTLEAISTISGRAAVALGELRGRRRDRGAGGDELRLLRRDARHGLGEHVPDGPVPLLRRDRVHPDRAQASAASTRSCADLAANPKTAPLLTRERIPTAGVLQLHVHPALLDHVPAHLRSCA